MAYNSKVFDNDMMQEKRKKMQLNWQVRAGALAAAALGLTGLAALRLDAAPPVGKAAPAFTSQTVEGKKISRVGYKGKSGVLLNFYSNT